MTDLAVRKFVETQRRLLELELQSEEEEEQAIAATTTTTTIKGESNSKEEVASHVLRNLETSQVSVGLYGRTVMTLSSSAAAISSTKLLPAHRFTVGDEVEIRSKSQSFHPGGVVSEVTETAISIALFGSRRRKSPKQRQSSQAANDDNAADKDDDDDDDVLGEPPLTVVPKSSAQVHRKLMKGLDELERHGADHPVAGNIVRAAFEAPTPAKPTSATKYPEIIQPLNSTLDESQLEAIQFGLHNNGNPIALIHGPPGTGKTTTVAELIHQAVHAYGMRVLVTAPSNVAVDNVLERLVVAAAAAAAAAASSSAYCNNKKKNRKQKQPLSAIRLGHPARIKPSILPYSLESLVQNADGTEIVADCRKEMQSCLKVLSNPKSRFMEKRAAYRELKSVRKEIRTREERVVQDLIANAQVVLATNVGAANSILANEEFDLVVIDEAAQALEASCWIPILKGKRLVLAGDHCQLPPTIKNRNFQVQKGLGETMFERIIGIYGDDSSAEGIGQVSRMLKVQYRMHEFIAGWASQAMYSGELRTHETVAHRTLSELSKKESSDVTDGKQQFGFPTTLEGTVMLLIDTAGCMMYEETNAAGSKYNSGEADVVILHVKALLDMGLKPHDIAVISPYNGQVEVLRNRLLPDVPTLEIRSVDGFQGGEREAVVVSMVRSSERGGLQHNGIGFLKDDRRLNVAITRAKRHVAVVCDSETVSQSSFIKGLISWMEERGEVRSAIEYLSTDEQNLENDISETEAQLLKMIGEGDNGARNMPLSAESSASVRPSPPPVDNDVPTVKDTDKVGRRNGPAPHAAGKRSSAVENTSMANSAVVDKPGVGAPERSEERRRELMNLVADFVEKGRKGDEMSLSPGLSKFDRLVVHEFAEQLGVGHRSEGVDGVDRRIIITILHEPKTKAVSDVESEERKAVDEIAAASMPSKFESLIAIDDESESSDSDKGDDEPHDSRPVNSLLGSLAQERMRREQEVERQRPKAGGTKSDKEKKTKKKAHRLDAKKVDEEDTSADFDDDMAFLDSQMKKVQTSHGRRVDGKGSEYRSIINGILIAKPPAPAKKKDAKASSALSAKLKQAQDGRRTKNQGRKKKK